MVVAAVVGEVVAAAVVGEVVVAVVVNGEVAAAVGVLVVARAQLPSTPTETDTSIPTSFLAPVKAMGDATGDIPLEDTDAISFIVPGDTAIALRTVTMTMTTRNTLTAS